MYLFLAGFFCCAALYVVARLIVNWRVERAFTRMDAELEQLRVLTTEEPAPRPTAFDALERAIDASNQRFVSASPLVPKLRIDLADQIRELDRHLMTTTQCGWITGFNLSFALNQPAVLSVTTTVAGGYPICFTAVVEPGPDLPPLSSMFAALHTKIDENTFLHRSAPDGGAS